ncbi:hypothetical protein GCM10009087_29700 [Sphingomonas oligophenolica]
MPAPLSVIANAMPRARSKSAATAPDQTMGLIPTLIIAKTVQAASHVSGLPPASDINTRAGLAARMAIKAQRLGPKRAMRRPRTGARSNVITEQMSTFDVMIARDQPNSAVKGAITTPVTMETAVMKMTPTKPLATVRQPFLHS